MSRVGIITFLHNDNYGSSLQAYALQRVIRELGHECEHLNYQPNMTEKVLNLLRSGNSPQRILEGLQKRSVYVRRQGARDKSMAIPEFYARRMEISRACKNLQELHQESQKYDILVCGSDQIWNPSWLNPAYFLTFAAGGVRKVAYAPSLGVQSLPSAGKVRRMRKWIQGFSGISVREKEGAELLDKIAGIHADVMPDPVCLLSREEWSEIAAPPPSADPYMLCYFIGENESYRHKVQEISTESGLRVFEIPVSSAGYQSGEELLEGLGPEEFLGAIKGASCICTDSFHGIVFGTLMGIRTEVMRRYRDDDPESKNSRVDHYLRIIREISPDEMRERGITWLKKQLEG